jgi:hypothetical protein
MSEHEQQRTWQITFGSEMFSAPDADKYATFIRWADVILKLIKTGEVPASDAIDEFAEKAERYFKEPNAPIVINTISLFTKAQAPPNGINGAQNIWRGLIQTAQELEAIEFPPVKFLIEKYMPEGAALLAGKPKLGKSWMLLQIATAVAGEDLVFNEECSHGPVLYLALEDPPRRLKVRMNQIMQGRQWPRRLNFAYSWKRLDVGGLDDMRAWLKEHPNAKLIIVDVLKRVRPNKKKDQDNYATDYEATQGLVSLCHEFPGLTILIAHHDRKMEAEDVFDTVSGTLGLTGAVDTVMILKRSASGVTMHVQGRDLIDTLEVAVQHEKETGRWSVLGAAADVQRSGQKKVVYDALKRNLGIVMTTKDLAIETGLDPKMLDTVLRRMAEDGEVDRISRGQYQLRDR